MFPILTVLASLAQAGCDAEATNASLGAVLDEAMVAYESLDVEGFSGATRRATDTLPCLSEVITPALAARLHRFRGLEAFVQRDLEMAELSFAAARALQPTYELPESLVPAGHPVLTHYQARPLEDFERVDVARPATGSLWLDGERGTSRLTGLPVIFQLEDSTVTGTELIAPGADLPRYPVEGGKPPKKPKGAGPEVNIGLLAAGAGATVVGGILWGLHASRGARWRDTYSQDCVPGMCIDDADLAKKDANTVKALGASAVTGALAGLSLVTLSFVLD